MNLEMTFLSGVIREVNRKILREYNISEDHFTTSDGIAVWDFVRSWMSHSDSYGTLPPLELVQATFPTVPFPRLSSETQLATLAQSLEHARLVRHSEDMLLEFRAVFGTEPRTALLELVEKARQLLFVSGEGRSLELFTDGPKAIERLYKDVLEADGVIGYSWPWEPLNRSKLGIEKENLVILYGRSGHMKTSLLVWMCAYYLRNYHANILFATPEMTDEQILIHLSMAYLGINKEAFYRGELDLGAFLSQVHDFYRPPDSGTSMKSPLYKFGKGTARIMRISNLGDLVEACQNEEYDAVFIDSFYYLCPGKKNALDWKAVDYTLRVIKKDVAEPCHAVVFASSQSNRSADPKVAKGRRSRDDHAFGDAVKHKSDFLIHVKLEEQPDQAGAEEGTFIEWLVLEFEKARHLQVPPPFCIGAKPFDDYEFIEYWKDPKEGQSEDEQRVLEDAKSNFDQWG